MNQQLEMTPLDSDAFVVVEGKGILGFIPNPIGINLVTMSLYINISHRWTESDFLVFRCRSDVKRFLALGYRVSISIINIVEQQRQP